MTEDELDVSVPAATLQRAGPEALTGGNRAGAGSDPVGAGANRVRCLPTRVGESPLCGGIA